jgi:hypothetical protein
MKTSLCSVLNSLIVNALKSESLVSKYSFTNQVFNYIENETNARSQKWVYCAPVELVKDLYQKEDHRLPLYSYDGTLDSLHVETRLLIKLGFATIYHQWLILDPDLVKNLDRIKVKENYIKAKKLLMEMQKDL